MIADLQGPKLRIGELAEPIVLETGRAGRTSAPEAAAHDGDLVVAPAVIGEVLAPGHDVLIDDGLVRLRVERGRAAAVRAARSSSAARSARTRA